MGHSLFSMMWQLSTRLLVLNICASFAIRPETYYDQQFADFKSKFNKTYSSLTEETARLKIFKENLHHYDKQKKMISSYSVGVTQFSDLSPQEFKDLYLGGYKNPSGVHSLKKKTSSSFSSDLPDSVDWRDQGAVSDIKNQGQCGSCWAFATTEMVESYAQINSGQLIELSAQQVTACTPNPLSCGGTGGCYGSIPQLGYTYIQLFGHVSETDYPYTSGSTTETGDCMYDFTNTAPAVGITGYNTLAPNDQDAVMTHLAEVGPLGVAVYASGWGGYRSGVYSGCAYDSNIALNHAVQLVGYGTD